MKPGNLLKLGVIVMMAATSLFAIETFEEYQTAMRAAAGGNGLINKNLQGDLAVVAKGAADAKAAFEQIKAYWVAKGAADAVALANTAMEAAGKVNAAATAGNAEAAGAAAKELGATCMGCHEAHRGPRVDGKFSIK